MDLKTKIAHEQRFIKHCERALLIVILIMFMFGLNWALSQDWKDYWAEQQLAEANRHGCFKVKEIKDLSPTCRVYYWERCKTNSLDTLAVVNRYINKNWSTFQKNYIIKRKAKCLICNKFPCLAEIDRVNRNIFVVKAGEFKLKKSDVITDVFQAEKDVFQKPHFVLLKDVARIDRGARINYYIQ